MGPNLHSLLVIANRPPLRVRRADLIRSAVKIDFPLLARRARRLAETVAEHWPGSVDPETVDTNIVCASAARLPNDLLRRLDVEGIRAGTIDTRTVRFVTHKDVDDADLERAVKTLAGIAHN